MILAIFACALALLCAICVAIWKRESRGRLILTPLLIFCANEVFRVWPAAIYARYMGISEDLYPTLVILLATFAFLIGYVAAGDLIGWRTYSPLSFWKRSILKASAGPHLVAIGVCSTLLVLAAMYLYQGLPPTVNSVTRLVTEGYSSGVAGFAAREREKYTKSHYFDGEYRGQGVVREYTAIGWPLLVGISLLLYLQRRSHLHLILSLVLLAACLVFIAGDGTRGAFLWAMISVVVALALVIRMRLVTLAGIGLLLLATLFGLSAVKKFAGYAQDVTFLKSGSTRIAERIFVGNGINTVHVIELVKCGRLDLRRGTIHLTEMLNSLPSVRFGRPFSHDLFRILHPYSTGTTYCTMTYLGRLYGDFGLTGSVVGFFMLGVFTLLASRFLFSRRKTVLNTVIIGAFLLRLGNLGINGPFALMGFAVVVLSVAMCYVVSFGIVYHCEQTTPSTLIRRRSKLCES